VISDFLRVHQYSILNLKRGFYEQFQEEGRRHFGGDGLSQRGRRKSPVASTPTLCYFQDGKSLGTKRQASPDAASEPYAA
jgi:hypothetical protein